MTIIRPAPPWPRTTTNSGTTVRGLSVGCSGDCRVSCCPCRLLQFIFDSLLNSPTMDQQSEVIFEHLQSLYRAHMEIDLPASTTHEERQAFISSMQKKQLIFIQRLEQEFSKLIPL